MSELNDHTRFYAPMPGAAPANVTGADNVLKWQTGYPFGVTQPRLSALHPGEFTTSDTLARGEADAA